MEWSPVYAEVICKIHKGSKSSCASLRLKNKDAYRSMNVSKHKLFRTEGEMCQSSEHSHLADNFFTHKSGLDAFTLAFWSKGPKLTAFSLKQRYNGVAAL